MFPIFFLVQSLNACTLLAWTWRRARARGLRQRLALDTGMILLATGLIGGRLLHVVWEEPQYYARFPERIFDLASGGYVYFGGFLLAALSGVLWIRFRDPGTTEKWMDLFAPVLSLGTAIGRIGCALAGCCYGKTCSLPWAVHLADENGRILPRHPTAIYSLLWELGVLAILLGVERIPLERRPRFLRADGSIFWLWLLLHGLGRLLIEFLRDDFRGPQLAGLGISQILSLIFMAAAAATLANRSAGPSSASK